MDTQTIPTLVTAKHFIYSIDFSKIYNKLTKHDSYGKRAVLITIMQYRNFLYLSKKFHNMQHLTPTQGIDFIWHNHILDTRQYQQDCIKIFGSYFHHYPYFGIDGQSNLLDLNNNFKLTQMLYKKEFGEYMLDFMPKSLIKRTLLGLLSYFHNHKTESR